MNVRLDTVVEDSGFELSRAPAKKYAQDDQLIDIDLDLPKRGTVSLILQLELAHLVEQHLVANEASHA